MNATPTTRPVSSLYRLIKRVALVLVLGALAAPAARAQTWMVSTTAYIKLGVLDKYNSLGGYQATFIVTNERTSQEFILTRDVPKGESGIDVLFPSEPSDAQYFKDMKGLAAQPTTGRYVWECRVKGKKVVSGRFEYPQTSNDVTVVDK